MSDIERFEEWRVTGQPDGNYPPYDFTWSPDCGPGDPEAEARGFCALIAAREPWTDGPHLYRRTVTRTPWEPVDEVPINPA